MAIEQNESPRERDLWSSLPELGGIERGQTYFDLSLLAFERGQHTKSLALAESACDCFRQHSDDVGYANCLTSIAFNLKELNRMQEALSALLKAVVRYAKSGDEQEWEYRFYLAQWFASVDEYDLALIQYQRLLEHSKFEGSAIATAGATDNMAKMLCEMDRCAEAVEHFKEARRILKQEGETGSVAISDLWIARCYNHLRDGISALAYANRAVSVFDSTNDRTRRAQAYAQMGRALNNLGRFEDALEALEVAHKFVTGSKTIDFQVIYVIQEGKVRALRGLGRESEAKVIERRNEAIKEILG